MQSHLQTALGAKIEHLIGKMCSNVSYFEIFCDLVDIIHDKPAATKIGIQVRGFLQLENNKAKKGLDKLLIPTVSNFLVGNWARCEGGLC